MSDFQAQIKAILDLSGIPSDIKKIESEKIKLSNIKVDTDGIKKDIQNALKDIKLDINVGGKGGNSGIDKKRDICLIKHRFHHSIFLLTSMYRRCLVCFDVLYSNTYSTPIEYFFHLPLALFCLLFHSVQERICFDIQDTTTDNCLSFVCLHLFLPIFVS